MSGGHCYIVITRISTLSVSSNFILWFVKASHREKVLFIFPTCFRIYMSNILGVCHFIAQGVEFCLYFRNQEAITEMPSAYSYYTNYNLNLPWIWYSVKEIWQPCNSLLIIWGSLEKVIALQRYSHTMWSNEVHFTTYSLCDPQTSSIDVAVLGSHWWRKFHPVGQKS